MPRLPDPIDYSVYDPLLKDNVPHSDVEQSKRCSLIQTHMNIFVGVFIAQLVVIILLLSYIVWDSSPHEPYLYFPAAAAVKYQIQAFSFGLNGDVSAYQAPPSPELDSLWEDLYSVGFQRISKREAAMLPNKTAPIPGDRDGFYITELDVFHQLHCLNAVRKALRPAYYPDMKMGNAETDSHIDHCIDSLRQSLMCSADISTIVWQWSDSKEENVFQGGIAHKCRNFGMIQEWAREHALENHYNTSIHMTDNIMIPIYRSDGSTYHP